MKQQRHDDPRSAIATLQPIHNTERALIWDILDFLATHKMLIGNEIGFWLYADKVMLVNGYCHYCCFRLLDLNKKKVTLDQTTNAKANYCIELFSFDPDPVLFDRTSPDFGPSDSPIITLVYLAFKSKTNQDALHVAEYLFQQLAIGELEFCAPDLHRWLNSVNDFVLSRELQN